MKLLKLVPLLFALVFVFSEPAVAQRGMGDPVGIVRQGVETTPATITGTLKEIHTGPCESTTGRALIGTHLIVETEAGEADVHLGPASALAPIVNQLEQGQQLTIEAFRTAQMPEDAFVARTVTADGHVFTLRDETLRPMWAGGAGAGAGQWAPPAGRRPGGRGWAAGRGAWRGGVGRCWAW